MEIKFLLVVFVLIFNQFNIMIYGLQIEYPYSCDENTLSPPFKLENFIPRTYDLQRITIKTTMFYLSDPKAEMITGYRQYWKSFCKAHHTVYADRCTHEKTLDVPTEEDLLKFDEKQGCETGPDVINDETHYFYNSNACRQDIKKRGEWHKQRKTINLIEAKKYSDYESCNINWGCMYEKGKIVVNLYLKEGIPGMRILHPELHTEFVLNSDKNTYFEGKNGFAHLIVKAPSIEHKEHELKCFWKPTGNSTKNEEYLVRAGDNENVKLNLSSENIYCEDTGKAYFFHVQSNKFCFRDTCHIVRDNGIQIVHHRELRKAPVKNYSNPDDIASSIADVQQLNLKLHMESEGLRFTLAELDYRFHRIVKQFNTMVLSVAKLDEKLIGRLLDRNDLITQFVTRDIFKTKTCKFLDFSTSNCAGEFVLRDGRAVINSDNSTCSKYNDTNSLDLFHFRETWWPSIGLTNVRGVARDQAAWQLIAEYKEAMVDSAVLAQKATAVKSLYGYGQHYIQNSFSTIYIILVAIIIMFVLIIIFKIGKTLLC